MKTSLLTHPLKSKKAAYPGMAKRPWNPPRVSQSRALTLSKSDHIKAATQGGTELDKLKLEMVA